jgi:hypothetical protein
MGREGEEIVCLVWSKDKCRYHLQRIITIYKCVSLFKLKWGKIKNNIRRQYDH